MNQLRRTILLTLMSLEVPLLAYLLLYSLYHLPSPNRAFSGFIAIIGGSIGLIIGSRILWELTAARWSTTNES